MRESVRVLFVCSANLCRSVTAAEYARRAAAEQAPAVLTWHFESSGTDVAPGQGLPLEVERRMSELGIPVRTTPLPLTEELIRSADLILTADRGHRAAVAQRFPFAVQRTFTLLEFAGLLRAGRATGRTGMAETADDLLETARDGRSEFRPVNDSTIDIPDPVEAGTASAMSACASTIQEAISAIMVPSATPESTASEMAQQGGRSSDPADRVGDTDGVTERDVDGRTIGLWPTIALLLALVIPFAVRMSTGVEPYPAAILPEGGSVLRIDEGTTSYQVATLLAYDGEGELVPVDIGEFSGPMWTQYLRSLVRDEFALGGTEDTEIKIRGVDMSFRIPRHRPTADEQEEIREWLSSRLREQGLDDGRLVIREARRDVDVATGEIVTEHTGSETVLDL